MTKKAPKDKTGDRRPEILSAVLAHVPFDGWSNTAMDRAAEDLGLDRGLVHLAFPEGPIGIIDYFSASADADMCRALETAPLEKFKLREKITLAVCKRIEAVAPHHQALRRSVALLALPIYAPDGFTMLCRTVDSMWRAVGDASTDFNYYTKRLTLAGVYSATLLYWLNDESEDHGSTWAFLDRRIEDVMKIEACKTQLKKPLQSMPDIWGFLGNLRYPGSGPR